MVNIPNVQTIVTHVTINVLFNEYHFNVKIYFMTIFLHMIYLIYRYETSHTKDRFLIHLHCLLFNSSIYYYQLGTS